MRIAVIGSRKYRRPQDVTDYVVSLSRRDLLISGGAEGVDKVAERAAEGRRIPRLICEPECEEGESGYVAALHARNDKVIRTCERLVAFHDGESRGTAGVIAKAKKAGKQVWVCTNGVWDYGDGRDA